MDHHKPRRNDLNEDERARARAYRFWLQSIDAHNLMHHKPADYSTLLRHPHHFRHALEAFHQAWVIAKLTA